MVSSFSYALSCFQCTVMQAVPTTGLLTGTATSRVMCLSVALMWETVASQISINCIELTWIHQFHIMNFLGVRESIVCCTNPVSDECQRGQSFPQGDPQMSYCDTFGWFIHLYARGDNNLQNL